MVQVHVPATVWGFESLRWHQENQGQWPRVVIGCNFRVFFPQYSLADLCVRAMVPVVCLCRQAEVGTPSRVRSTDSGAAVPSESYFFNSAVQFCTRVSGSL